MPSSNVSDTTVCARALEAPRTQETTKSVARDDPSRPRAAGERETKSGHAGVPSLGARLAAAYESDADQGSRKPAPLATEISYIG